VEENGREVAGGNCNEVKVWFFWVNEGLVFKGYTNRGLSWKKGAEDLES